MVRLQSNGDLDWPTLLGFFRLRQTPGVETVDGVAYSRNVRMRGVEGRIHIVGDSRGVSVSCSDALLPLSRDIVDRVRQMFDLDADCRQIASHLRMPECRLPGCWDPFELSIRAVLGQQVSVAAARTFAGRLVAAAGRQDVFPPPADLATTDLAAIGLTRTRAATIRRLSEAAATDRMDYSFGALTAIAGIGRWTAQYIAMRALKDGDAFPSSDLVLRRALNLSERQLLKRAELWRPWRAYATIAIWSGNAGL